MPILLALLAQLGAGDAAPAVPPRAPTPLVRRWTTLDRTSGLPSNKTTAVLAAERCTWIGTDHGLACVGSDGRVRVYSVEQGLPHAAVTSLSVDPDTGDLWVGTLGGLARFTGGRIDRYTQITSGLANDVVYDVAAQGGSVWAATAAGTSHFDTRTSQWEIFDQTNARMHEPWCYGIALSNDTIYIGVWGGGVMQRALAGGEWREHRDPDGDMEVDLLRDDGLVHDVVSNVSFSDGVLWVSTYFGISRYDGRRWQTFCKSDSGLASDFNNTVFATQGLVFCATDRGLSMFDGERWATYRREADGSGSRTVTDRDGRDPVAAKTEGALPDSHVLDVHVRGDDVWVATLAGAAHGILQRERPTSKNDPAPAKSGAIRQESQR